MLNSRGCQGNLRDAINFQLVFIELLNYGNQFFIHDRHDRIYNKNSNGALAKKIFCESTGNAMHEDF